MQAQKLAVSLFLVGVLGLPPADAEEAANPTTESASETGKNEIPVCPKLVPIEVTLSADYPHADRAEVLKTYEVPKRVEYAIACELERQGYGVVKPFQLKVTINNFRLRSGGSAAVVGIMAGVDRVGMNIEVFVQGENEPWRFEVSNKTSKGGWRMPAPSQRLNAMVQKNAKDVISKIKKKGYLKEA